MALTLAPFVPLDDQTQAAYMVQLHHRVKTAEQILALIDEDLARMQRIISEM